MKSIILLIFIILGIFSFGRSQNNSKTSYSKEIYKQAGSDIFSVSIQAESSNKFSIIIKLSRSNHLGMVTYESVILDKRQFEKFIVILNTYQKWQKIVIKNKVQIDKTIDTIQISNENVDICEMLYHDFDIVKHNTYKLIEFKFSNENLILDIIGEYYLDSSKMFPNSIYDTKSIHENEKFYSLEISKNNVNKIIFLLTGVNFKKIQKDIDEKIKVWDELK